MKLLHTLLENSADAFPQKHCIISKDVRLTYREFDQRVNQLAHMLLSAGVQPGDRVGIHLEKSIEEAQSIFAASKIGAVFVTLNSALKDDQVTHIINDCSIVSLITSRKLLKRIQACKTCPSLINILLTPGATSEVCGEKVMLDFAALETNEKNSPACTVTEEELAAIIYTSGSTGMPKGVMLTHKNIVTGADSVSTYVKNTSDDIILSILPFSFDYGLNQLTTCFKIGGTIILKAYNIFTQDIIETMAKERVTGLAAIPTMWIQLLHAKNINKHTFKHLRYITNSGGKLSREHVNDLQRSFKYTKIYLMYGFTEAFRCTYLDPDLVNKKPTSIGKTVPFSECFVVNSQGIECGPDETGELIQRGPLVSKGYWGNPEETSKKIGANPLSDDPQDIVCYSGDLVKKDEDGDIYFVERKDGMLKCSGYRISPTEIEQVLYKNSAIKDAVALGIPDEKLGQTIKIVVMKKDESFTEKDLQRYCKNNLPSYMLPSVIQFVDKMPLTSSGKIDRNKLK